jgi:hypothetical protein
MRYILETAGQRLPATICSHESADTMGRAIAIPRACLHRNVLSTSPHEGNMLLIKIAAMRSLVREVQIPEPVLAPYLILRE